MTGQNRKIVIATFGSLGDLHPFVALAHALEREGLEPVIATSGAYRGFVEGEELGFAPVRPDADDVTERLGMDMGEIARRMTKNGGFLFQKLIFPFLRESYEDVLAASEGAAAVVAHSIAFAAQIAAEKRGLPLLNVVLSPVFFMSAYDPPQGWRAPFVRAPHSFPALAYNKALLWSLTQLMGLFAAPIGRLRRDVGLPPRSGGALLTGGPAVAATFGLHSPLLAPPQPDHPPDALIAGHTFHDRYLDAAHALEPELEAFLAAGPKPLVVTLGSFVVHGKTEFYRTSVAAIQKLGRRAVLLTREEEREALRVGLPPGMFAAAYVPHSLLLPRACAVIHHGGIGTTGQALRAGVPQLVTPFLGDQPDNAARLVRLGVARRLAHRRYTVDGVAHELETLLADETCAKHAAEIGAAVAREDGAARAARAIAYMLEHNPKSEGVRRTTL